MFSLMVRGLFGEIFSISQNLLLLFKAIQHEDGLVKVFSI